MTEYTHIYDISASLLVRQCLHRLDAGVQTGSDLERKMSKAKSGIEKSATLQGQAMWLHTCLGGNY